MELGRHLSLVDVRFWGVGGERWWEEIRGLPGVSDVALLGSGDATGAVRVTYRDDPFLPLLRRLRLLRHLPIPIQDGVATWTVVGPEPRVRRLLRSLRDYDHLGRVELVRHGSVVEASSRLTARQAEVFHRALSAGYFDVPRKVSLTELAGELGVAISTLSVMLALIERKLLVPYG